MTPLRMLCARRPEVSVVMVTFNAWEWTDRALRALADNTVGDYEVVIVDNNSQDGTLSGLAEVDGIRLLRNGANLGFGLAANQGAAAARAPRLAFLNTDALAHPGWLEPLARLLDDDAEVAAVAPRMLNLDGSLQEAGSILWRDGLVINYGDRADAETPEHRFRRDVDYASAACMLMRRSAFCAVGGFDPIYAPAYFEDVDLCQALWQRGMRTVYQPLSTVTHARWASTDRSRAVGLIERNLPIFRRRWRHLLERRPERPARLDERTVLLGRDAPCPDRVLVVADRVPDPAGSAHDARVAALARDLVRMSPATRVTLVSAAAAGGQAAAQALLADGVEVAWPGDRLEAWLDRRVAHYDAVVACGAAAAGTAGAAVASSQPVAGWAWDVTTAGEPGPRQCRAVIGAEAGAAGTLLVPDAAGPARDQGLRAAMATLGVGLLRGRA